MNFDLNDDQAAIVAGVEQLVARHPLGAERRTEYFVTNPALERDLRASDFLNVARSEGLGSLEAVLVVEGLARSPFALEITASGVVLPMLGIAAEQGPVALFAAPYNAPVRFLAPGGVAFVDAGDVIRRIDGARLAVEDVDAIYAYPLGRTRNTDVQASGEVVQVEPEEFRRYWRLGLVAEIVGAMQTALDLTVEYVKTRKQFGQPLGAFQAIQHRLSESHVLVQGSRFLLYAAATDGGADSAALAASYAQDAAARLVYETHQFHGAMGLTLEYPLHHWSYRLRVLQGELGGATANALRGAELAWPASVRIPDGFKGQADQSAVRADGKPQVIEPIH